MGPDAQGQWTVVIGSMRIVVPEHQLARLANDKLAPRRWRLLMPMIRPAQGSWL